MAGDEEEALETEMNTGARKTIGLWQIAALGLALVVSAGAAVNVIATYGSGPERLRVLEETSRKMDERVRRLEELYGVLQVRVETLLEQMSRVESKLEKMNENLNTLVRHQVLLEPKAGPERIP